MVIVDAWLPRAAAARPDHPAINEITYAELLDRARRAPTTIKPGLSAEETAIRVHATLLRGGAEKHDLDATALVAARAERERPLAREHDHADRRVLARPLERVRDLDDRLRPERVAHLRPVDRDLRDAVAAELVADVLVLGGGGPRHGHQRVAA